jgi:hypothetical protein
MRFISQNCGIVFLGFSWFEKVLLILRFYAGRLAGLLNSWI